ncbi:hypothetical protein TVAG_176200 [Trichomonas vaginalis G3]|uniref:Uncharacterized protein n=1 Tax=Trichomonas vaginalis (strain ATCC PRA-98 / G3) TaxID=412133 RepID=A2GD36_TRIV3|nr:hypothetical protein TVAGG3_0342900 [Trichomonas vaginalis G3]EAX84932.1 hypothetical protein TVAG_176200 [Trichomonas vaginalis G3]KAI5530778.1 hypothetical protein TVAGG3_0342900 [Trichomonas vaginalis G3]|eukprot:XP_001297862.1 hypothetical protein [Trichomonas vaginalis G3]
MTLSSSLLIQEEINKYKSDLMDSMKTKYKNFEKFCTEKTAFEHLQLYIDLLQRIKLGTATPAAISSELIDISLISPTVTDFTNSNLDFSVFINLIKSLSQEEHIKACIISIAFYLLHQNLKFTEFVITFLFHDLPELKDSVLGLFWNAVQLGSPNITEKDFQNSFKIWRNSLEYLMTIMKSIQNLSFYFHTAKFVAEVINLLLTKPLNFQKLVSPEIVRLLCYNPFTALYISQGKSVLTSAYFLPPLSLLLNGQIETSINLLVSYMPYALDAIASFLVNLPFASEQNADMQFALANKLLHNLSLGISTRDLYLIILRHFIKAPILREYYNNFRKLIFSNTALGLRQAYICILIAAFTDCETPGLYSLIQDCRESIAKIFQFSTMLFTQCAVVNRITEMILIFLENPSFKFNIQSPTHYIMLQPDQKVIEMFPVLFQTLNSYTKSPGSAHSYFSFIYSYLMKSSVTKLDTSFALEILSSIERFHEYPSDEDCFSIYRRFIRKLVVTKTNISEFILICLTDLQPMNALGALSFVNYAYQFRIPDFISYIKTNRSFIVNLIKSGMQSELPAMFYTCYELMSLLVEDPVVIVNLIEDIFNFDPRNSRKKLRLLCLLAFTSGIYKIDQIYKGFLKILESLKKGFSTNLAYVFVLRFLVYLKPENAKIQLLEICNCFHKSTIENKYYIRKTVEDILKNITLSHDDLLSIPNFTKVITFEIENHGQYDYECRWDVPYGPVVWLRPILCSAYIEL